MLPTYHENTFDEEQISCKKCSWIGKGIDAITIDFYGVTNVKDVNCPKCDKKIGQVEINKGGTPGESATDLSFQLG